MIKKLAAIMLIYSLCGMPLNAFVIKSGNSGDVATVDSEKRLTVQSVTEFEFEHASEEGDAYSWTTSLLDNTSDGDTLLLIKNTSNDEELHIETVWVSISTNAGVIFHSPTIEVTPTGTTVTGKSLKRPQIKAADADAKERETNNTQGDIIMHVFPEAGELEVIEFKGSVILAQNQSFAIDATSGAARAVITIWGHYGD